MAGDKVLAVLAVNRLLAPRSELFVPEQWFPPSVMDVLLDTDAHGTERDPAKLWQRYVQLSEAEAAFRTLKSEVKVRPIWHWTAERVDAHVRVAFLGYCLWVGLKKKAERRAPQPDALADPGSARSDPAGGGVV